MKNFKFYPLLLLCSFILGSFTVKAQTEWEKKQASIMTPWSENINPDDLFNEYPRPQMVRDNWVNLNGIWDFAKNNNSKIGSYSDFTNYSKKILVPFPIESALSGIMDTDYANLNKAYAYKRTFTIPATNEGKKILLHFGAVDWHCVVFVNQTKVGEHKGGYDSFTIDITNSLKPLNEEQELVAQIYDPTKGGQPRGKQDTHPGGIWYTPSSGIWQTVWYEAVNETYISNFTVVPDVDNATVKIKIDAPNASDASVDVTVLDGATEVARQTISTGIETAISIPNPKLWSPDSPFLYHLNFELKDGNQVVDNVGSYFGMRKITLGKLRGKPFTFLNDKPIFHYGTLDQGFWPDGLNTAPSYEALRWDLEKTKELGFNMVRKHIKTEPARWYFYCDSIGLMVWQDMANPIESGDRPLGDATWVKENFYRETTNIINDLRNYPSIVIWVPYNEGWGQFDGNSEHSRKGVELIRKLDTTRLINQSSGWTNFEIGDILDKHNYTTPALYENPFNHRANVCGETGGYSLIFDDHIWSHSTNIYNTLSSSEELTTKLEELNAIGFDLTTSGFAGVVYTQITDVEEELNGFYTYDRKISKLNDAQKARFKAGIQKLQTKALYLNYIVPTAIQTDNSVWKYKTGGRGYNVASGWNSNVNYNVSTWQEGAAGFGNGNPPNSKTRTTWDTETIYLRKQITLPANLSEEDKADLKLSVYYDEDFDLYINGVLAASAKGYSTSYNLFDIYPAAKSILKYGEENLFAIRCIQTGGGQYIDLGVVIARELDLNEEVTVPQEPKTFVEISEATGLDVIRNDLSGFYRLTADIDLADYTNFTPIGTASNPFRGYLEGGQHVIKNLKINRQGNDCQALFASANGAFISELEIADANVKGSRNVGSLIGKCVNTSIQRVVVTNPQINGLDRVGGIVGETENGEASLIKDCYVVDGDINTRSSGAGGIVGMAQNTRIENSYFTGSVSAPLDDAGNSAGGILGVAENVAVQFRGVASLATGVTGGSAGQFAPTAFPLVEQTNIYTRSNMVLSANSYGANRATDTQRKYIAEFQTQALYNSMGWDFDNVWEMPENGFPVFKAQFGTSIKNVSDLKSKNLKTYSSDGKLIFESIHPASVWVYTAAGVLSARLDTQKIENITLPQGIYIVKSLSQGIVETAKVINF
jgi:beta-galactosidase/beta-glucuronidase